MDKWSHGEGRANENVKQINTSLWAVEKAELSCFVRVVVTRSTSANRNSHFVEDLDKQGDYGYDGVTTPTCGPDVYSIEYRVYVRSTAGRGDAAGDGRSRHYANALRMFSTFHMLRMFRTLSAFGRRHVLHNSDSPPRLPQHAAPSRGLSDSSLTCCRPRRPPLQSFALRGSVHDRLRSPATTRPSRAHPPFPFPTALHSRAALAIRHRHDRNRYGPTYDTSHHAEACALTCAASCPQNPVRLTHIPSNHLGCFGHRADPLSKTSYTVYFTQSPHTPTYDTESTVGHEFGRLPIRFNGAKTSAQNNQRERDKQGFSRRSRHLPDDYLRNNIYERGAYALLRTPTSVWLAIICKWKGLMPAQTNPGLSWGMGDFGHLALLRKLLHTAMGGHFAVSARSVQTPTTGGDEVPCCGCPLRAPNDDGCGSDSDGPVTRAVLYGTSPDCDLPGMCGPSTMGDESTGVQRHLDMVHGDDFASRDSASTREGSVQHRLRHRVSKEARRGTGGGERAQRTGENAKRFSIENEGLCRRGEVATPSASAARPGNQRDGAKSPTAATGECGAIGDSEERRARRAREIRGTVLSCIQRPKGAGECGAIGGSEEQYVLQWLKGTGKHGTRARVFRLTAAKEIARSGSRYPHNGDSNGGEARTIHGPQTLLRPIAKTAVQKNEHEFVNITTTMGQLSLQATTDE
ncbi:hypothetical protein EDB84DRAFT_1629047 [Lactarius hengduanensis]|nr:hypothetical protein EDB84DRAFT_1629047 [Lactarius hengduanensis]